MSNTQIRINTTSTALRVWLAFSFGLVILWTVSMKGFSQASPDNVLPPAASGLISIHLPDTRDLEPEVREHLSSARDTLAAAIRSPALPAAELAEAYGKTGDLYHAYSLEAPAIECYENASKLAPKDFRWVYMLGKLYERAGDAQKAIGNYETAVTLRADYPPVFVSLGNIYLQLNRPDEAEGFFRRALAANDAIAAAQYGLGQAALSKRNYATAVAHLEKALSLAPQANRLHYALAMAYRGVGDIEKAQAHLALSGPVGVRAVDPLIDGLQNLVMGARLNLIRGRAALEARRYSEAAEEFRKAVSKQPGSIPAHLNLGAALSQTGDLTGAINEFEETLRLDPGHTNAHYNLGLLLAQTNKHEEAIQHLRSVVNSAPSDNNARLLLAQQLVNVNRLAEAETEYRKLVESDPNNEDALLGLVRVLLAKKQYSQALVVLEKGHSGFPHKQLTTVTLAHLLAASPAVELRDGKRALDLAAAVYDVTGALEHGRLVTMALAELGRCDEAAARLRGFIVKASTEGTPELIEKLKAELARYETARPCRPTGDTAIGDYTPLP